MSWTSFKSGIIRILPVLGLFLGMWLLFQAVFFLGTSPASWLGTGFQFLAELAWNRVDNIELKNFLVYGLISGLGGFAVYLPNIIILFLFSHLLKETSLDQKAAAIADPFLRPLGLGGCALPVLFMGFGCTAASLNAAQYLKNPSRRLLTMLASPFFSCGAKYGVYVLLISALFPRERAGSILFFLYCLGILTSILTALLFRRILRPEDDQSGIPSPANLKVPDLKRVVQKAVIDGWHFVKTAGTAIVIAAILVWFLSSRPGISQPDYDTLSQYAAQTGQVLPPRATLTMHHSYLARFGQWIAPVFTPLGHTWKTSVAIIAGLTGRGAVVTTLFVLYGLEPGPHSPRPLADRLARDNFSRLAGFSFMVFLLLSGSCLAGISLFYRQTASISLTGLFILYPLGLAWIVSFLVYRGLRLWAGG